VKLSERVTAVTICVVLVLVGLSYFTDDPTPPIPAPVQQTLDSLTETQPIFDSVVTNLMAGADRRAAEDRRLARKERALIALADTLRARKDSLALDASQHPDSAAGWRRAYVAADSEATALRVVVDTLHARVDTLTARGDSLHLVATLALARLDVTSGVVVDLRAAIVKATECRWAGRLALPCPSRRTAFLGGLALGLVGLATVK
jgi:hypothetical protein